MDFDKGSLSGINFSRFLLFPVISMLFTLFFMSFASANRYKLEEEIKAADMPETLQAWDEAPAPATRNPLVVD